MKIRVYNPRKPDERPVKFKTTRQRASKFKTLFICSAILNVILAGYLVYINN